MNSAYKAQIKQNAIESATGTVASAWSGIKEKLREAVEQKVREALSGLGSFADAAASKLGAIVDKILSYIPDIDPSVLIAEILK